VARPFVVFLDEELIGRIDWSLPPAITDLDECLPCGTNRANP
jgi:hypothetical protein